jgi:predicted ferric reductase
VIAGQMNPQLMWWFARATGMVAGVVLVASLVFGVLITTRWLKPIDRPAWLLAMHRWLSALACVLIALHLFGLVADNYVHFGWKEVFVHGGSPWKRGPVALGVIALYLLAIVQGTSMLQQRLPSIPRKLWKFLHYFSYIAVWLTSLHGALAGTDAKNFFYKWVALMLTFAAVAAAIIRVVVGTTRAQAARRAEQRRLAAVGQSSNA